MAHVYMNNDFPSRLYIWTVKYFAVDIRSREGKKSRHSLENGFNLYLYFTFYYLWLKIEPHTHMSARELKSEKAAIEKREKIRPSGSRIKLILSSDWFWFFFEKKKKINQKGYDRFRFFYIRIFFDDEDVDDDDDDVDGNNSIDNDNDDENAIHSFAFLQEIIEKTNPNRFDANLVFNWIENERIHTHTKQTK